MTSRYGPEHIPTHPDEADTEPLECWHCNGEGCQECDGGQATCRDCGDPATVERYTRGVHNAPHTYCAACDRVRDEASRPKPEPIGPWQTADRRRHD